MTSHAKELTDPFNIAYSLIILLQLSGVTIYLDVYSKSIVEYKNEDIPTAEELPWDPKTN